MRELPAVAFALAVLFAFGRGLARHAPFAPPRGFRSPVCALAWAWTLGAGGAGVLLALATGSIGFACWPVYAATLFAWALPAGAAAPGDLDPPPERSAAARVFHVALVAWLVTLTAGRIGSDLGWDGWAVWSIKARAIHAEDRLDTRLAADLARFGFSHPDYPPGLPLLEVWIWRHTGRAHDRTLGLLHAAFACALAGLTLGLARRRTHGPCAPALALLVLTQSTLWLSVVAGQADPLMLAYNLALLALFSEEAPARAAAALLIAAALGTKNEGLVTAVAAGAALLAASPRAPARPLFVLAAALLTALPWWLIKHRTGLVVDLAARGLAPFADWPGRAAGLAAGLAAHAVRLPGPAPLMWVTAASLAALPPARRPATLFALLLIPGLLAVYVLTPADQGWLLETSLDRVLCQVLPVVLFAPERDDGSSACAASEAQDRSDDR